MSLLFTPISFSGLTSRNRIVMPPMATAFTPVGGSLRNDGLPGDDVVAHYRERAQNGVGILIVEHTYVSRRGKAHKGQLGLDQDSDIPEFRRLAHAIRSGGAVAVLQINHAGASGSYEVTGGEPLGPSDIPMPKSDKVPTPMSVSDIEEVQYQFAETARRARLAGFDAVEIHAAHGYLMSQFLSPITNIRKDGYGGSLENRARFLLETVAKVKDKAGPDFPIFVRLGAVDGLEGGLVPDDAAHVAIMLEDLGVSLIDVSGGLMGSRPSGVVPGWFVPTAATIKSRVKIPVMVTGGITEGPFAERILQEGKADLIGVGRALLSDPRWVEKARKSV